MGTNEICVFYLHISCLFMHFKNLIFGSQL